MREVLSIQYLRAAAATMVVVYHVAVQLLPPGATQGFAVGVWASGVDVFFVVSGFIMWSTTAGRAVSTTDFWRARLARIVPMWWIALAVYWVVLALRIGLDATPRLDEVAKAAAFLPQYDRITGIMSPYLVAGWTLTHEMIFYFVFGAALFLPRGAARFAFVTMVFVAAASLRGHVDATDPWAFRLTSPLALEFVAGMAIAAAHGRWRDHALAPVASGFLATAAVVWTIGLSGPHFFGWPRLLDFGVPAAALVAAAVLVETRIARRPIGWLKRLGDASYSLYLVHGMVVEVAVGPLRALGLGDAVTAAVLFAGAMASGLLVWRFVERPIAAKLASRRRRASSVATSASVGASAGAR